MLLLTTAHKLAYCINYNHLKITINSHLKNCSTGGGDFCRGVQAVAADAEDADPGAFGVPAGSFVGAG